MEGIISDTLLKPHFDGSNKNRHNFFGFFGKAQSPKANEVMAPTHINKIKKLNEMLWA